jgi:hypothetical protein
MKSTTAVMLAAAIAAAATILTAPSSAVTAGPLPPAASSALKACAERPWPYFGCVGTPFGNPKVRLITVERLGG